jgi:hypothetical protein
MMMSTLGLAIACAGMKAARLRAIAAATDKIRFILISMED